MFKEWDKRRKTTVTFCLHVRAVFPLSVWKLMGSVLHRHTKPPLTPSLLHSCVLVGWFVTSRSALWIMKSVKPLLTFTPRDAYKPPSSLPCLRVSPPLGTCCFKDGQQSEEMLAVVKFSQIVGAMSLGLLRAHTLLQHCSTYEFGHILGDLVSFWLFSVVPLPPLLKLWRICFKLRSWRFQDGLQHFSDSARKHTKLSSFIPTQPPESMKTFPFYHNPYALVIIMSKINIIFI